MRLLSTSMKLVLLLACLSICICAACIVCWPLWACVFVYAFCTVVICTLVNQVCCLCFFLVKGSSLAFPDIILLFDTNWWKKHVLERESVLEREGVWGWVCVGGSTQFAFIFQSCEPESCLKWLCSWLPSSASGLHVICLKFHKAQLGLWLDMLKFISTACRIIAEIYQ